MCMSSRQPASSMAIQLRQASLLAPDSAALVPGVPSGIPPQWILNFNFEHSVWMQTLQKLLRFDQIEFLVTRLYAKEEAVFRRESKPCDVENRVIRRGEAIHRQHAENG